MRSPPSWCTEQQLENLNISDLIIKDNKEAPSSNTTDSLDSLAEASRIILGEYINKLPPEVLSEIFYWCVPTNNDQESYNPCAALTLSQVCRRWRAIALSSPQLWTYTKVRVMQGSLKPALNTMALYLERAKSQPVLIDVDFIDLFSYYRPVLDLFEEIVSKARECKPPELIASSFLATHLEATSTEQRPTREEWYFWSARPALPEASETGSQRSDVVGSVGDVESLVTIRALRVAVGSFVLGPYLPWASSLTFLILRDLNDFTNLTTAEATLILSSFPLLIHCSLHIDFESVTPNALHPNMIELQYLKSFSLSWLDWIDVGPLLDVLSTPELRELELIGRLPDADMGGNWSHFVHFLQRNRPPLNHLILEQIDCFHISFISAVPHMPYLEGLWLEDCLLDESIIRSLAPVLSSTLKTLVILECYAFNIEELIKVLRSTERPGGVKVKAFVEGCGDVAPAHIKMIEEMELDNLEIGPSSMPADMNVEDDLERSLEFVDAV